MDLFLRVRVFGGGGGGSIRFVVVGDCWEWSESVSATSVAVVDQHMSSCCSEKQGVTGVWGGLVEFMTVQTVGIARGIYLVVVSDLCMWAYGTARKNRSSYRVCSKSGWVTLVALYCSCKRKEGNMMCSNCHFHHLHDISPQNEP